MTNEEAVALIDGGTINGHPQRWLDLGCGGGTFTEALATILPEQSEVTGVDKSIQQLPAQMGNHVRVNFMQADFEKEPIGIQGVDGILMANSLHFMGDKKAVLRRLETLFSSSKRFLIVEYDTLASNPWVPYPIDLLSLKELFAVLGPYSITKLGERKSRYGSAMIYGALITSNA